MADTKKYEPRLKTEYVERISKAMQEKFSYANVMQIPRLDKIVINMGVGESTGDSKKPTVAAADLAAIAGQKPVITRARNSIAGFKLREGMPIGAKVTLRGARMYEFLDRLISVALPRVRIQHTDVSQGPLERRYGIGTLKLYTAGSRHTRIELPGLNHDDAIALRDALLAEGGGSGV